MTDAARPMDEPKGCVLLVDDDPHVLRAYERLLGSAGYAVTTAPNGLEAIERLRAHAIDVIVSDIGMPEMDGISLLRAVRERDLDLPIILTTGQPTVETAAQAVQHGAMGYLFKPVLPDELIREVQRAVRFHQWAKLRRVAHDRLGGDASQTGDRAGLQANFSRALSGMWMAYQPVVSWKSKSLVGYEALMRTSEPSLPFPDAVLKAAERLDRCEDVGRTVRGLVAATLTSSPSTPTTYVNLHVRDLLDEALYSEDAPLSAHAKRVILEITERAALDEIADVRGRIGRLRKLGYRIAVDDLGAGYSGLSSFAQMEPDVVKLDMSLIRDVHKEPIKQKLIASFAALSKDMGLLMIAEGVETADERDALVGLGCDLFQGYLFARPGKPFPSIVW